MLMKEKEYNVVTLEDGIEYTEINRLVIDDKTYVLLSNLEKPDDFCVRRIANKDDGEYIVGLDSRKEFDKVMEIFMKKYTN